jgi:hypothetical protein
MSLRILITFCFACLLNIVSSGLAAQQEGVTLNPQTGNYLVIYRSGYSGQLETVEFIPSTKIKPRLQSKFDEPENAGTILYRYKLKSEPASEQKISMLLAVVSNIAPGGVESPQGWDGIVAPVLNSTDLRIGWNYHGAYLGGLAPGKDITGFSLKSRDLPGVNVIQITGAAPVTQWPSHSPAGEVGKQLELIEKADYVPRNAAVPRINVPTPYDAAVVLTNIQKHLDTDLVGLKLVDPALVAQMDPWFATAIDAAKRNNVAGLRNALQELRRLLKQECADVDQEGNETETDDKPVAPARIAKLAARVLNFDLKYVGSRI